MPEVVLLRFLVMPARTALAEPSRRSKLPVVVSVLVPVPVMLPPVVKDDGADAVRSGCYPGSGRPLPRPRVTAPVLRTLLAPYARVPSLTVVRPVWRLAPERVSVPARDLGQRTGGGGVSAGDGQVVGGNIKGGGGAGVDGEIAVGGGIGAGVLECPVVEDEVGGGVGGFGRDFRPRRHRRWWRRSTCPP